MTDDPSIASEFPIKGKTAYFNNASYTPTLRSSIEEISRRQSGLALHGPDDDYLFELIADADLCREELGGLVGVDPQTITFTESATEGINFVANGFKLKRGDVVVTRGGSDDHPSNYLPWVYYTGLRGARIQDLAVDSFGTPDMSELDKVLKRTGARLVVLTHVLANLGTIMPAREIGRVAHDHDAKLFLDVSQSVGSIPVNLSDVECDFAAGTGAKWLCGPLGIGFFYCKKDSLDSLNPLAFGMHACRWEDKRDMTPLDDGRRFEEAFRNWTYPPGLTKAVRFIRSIGMDSIRSTNVKLADMIIESIPGVDKEYVFKGNPDSRQRTSIVPVEPINRQPSEIVQHMRQANVTVARREIRRKGVLRISPHFYNDEKEVERLLKLM
jgi:cysteine desulfurase / selenocysteine lyase